MRGSTSHNTDQSLFDGVDPRNRLNALSNREWLKRTKSVWYSRPGPRDELKQQHPATFAESDVVRLIELFTRPGERVLDPFLGSGSTLIAAERTGRKCYGFDLDARYCDVILARWEAFTGETATKRS